MSLSPRGLCLGLCWACAGLVLGLWACVPGNPFHAAHPLGRLVPSGLRVLRLWAPCPLARASLGPCVPFCVRPRGGCAGHPLGRSVPSAPGLPLRPASLSASAREAGAQGTRWDAQCRQGVASCALKIVSCKNEKHLFFKDDPPKKRFSRRCSPILGTKRTYATIHQSSSSNPPPPIQ